MTYLKNKTVSFYLIVLAAVLSLIALPLYKTASISESNVIVIVIVAAVVAVAMIVLAGVGKFRFLNLTATVCAILLTCGLVMSINAQLDPLGWWVAGLYTYDQVKGYIFFAALVGIAILLDLVASFIDLQK